MKRIFNIDKTIELKLEDLDLKRGNLSDDYLEHWIEEQPEIPEEGHYEVLREYPNGGRDIEWKVDRAGQDYCPAHIEYEEILVYSRFSDDRLKELGLYEWSEEELEEIRHQDWDIKKDMLIQQVQKELTRTDMYPLKYIEGIITEDEFEFWKVVRQNLRNEINSLRALEYEKDYEKIIDLFNKDELN